jgi:hypothetical protein
MEGSMSVADEFRTVDLILSSDAETRGVDAFALSLIRAEKQARRLVTYLVYQHSWCSPSTVPRLKQALENRTDVYFRGLLAGWDAIYSRSVQQIVGPDYTSLRPRMDEATKYRNKVFHGQLTSKGLSRSELVHLAADIRRWCQVLGNGADTEVGYDGCGRNSFQKASNAAHLRSRYKTQLRDIADYERFINDHMRR